MTEQASGALSKLLLGFESIFGTAPADGFVMPVVSSTLKQTRNKKENPLLRSDYNSSKPIGGRWSVAGQVTVLLDSIALWYWMKAAFNTITTTGSGTYAHEFKMTGITARGSLSIEHQYLDLATPQYFLYTGCKIAGFSFAQGDEGEHLVVFDIVGCKETTGAVSFDASPTSVSYYALDETHSSITEGGSPLANSEKVDVSVAFNQDVKYAIGGLGFPTRIKDGKMSVTGNISAMFDDMTLYTKAVNSTESAIVQTFNAAADRGVVFSYPEIEYTPNSPEISGPQGIAVNLPWQGFYDDGAAASSIVCTITNAEAHA